MIATTSLGWYAFGVASALVPSGVAVLILVLHARRSPPVREPSDTVPTAYARTWQCSDCLQLYEQYVNPCPNCRGVNPRMVGGPWSEKQIELYAPNKQRKAAG